MAQPVSSDLIHIFKTSVSAVLPENLIRNTMKYYPTNEDLLIAGQRYNMQNKNVYLVGAGKAVQNMAREVETILKSKIKGGVISIPVGSLNIQSEKTTNNVLYCEGAKNNLPDGNAENTAHKIRDLCIGLNANDLLLVLISGGGSALLPLPKEPITLKEKTKLIKKLANKGADIKELNTVRKKLSNIKGGQLAVQAQPALVISLILSDIVGDPLDLIASGPTVENKDDHRLAVDIINKYKLFNCLPQSIVTILYEKNNLQQFPKDNVQNHIIGSNTISIKAAVDEAKKLSYFPIELSNIITGDVRDIAKEYAILVKVFGNFIMNKSTEKDFKKEIYSLYIPGIQNCDLTDTDSIKNKDLCLILGGEITVKVNGVGKGGRNQQLALEFSNYIHSLKEYLKSFDIFFLSAGTDGIDGPTDAAGAIGYLNLISDADLGNINVNEYLENKDSYNFYKRFRNSDLHVITGHTDTNVMDIHLIIIRHKK